MAARYGMSPFSVWDTFTPRQVKYCFDSASKDFGRKWFAVQSLLVSLACGKELPTPAWMALEEQEADEMPLAARLAGGLARYNVTEEGDRKFVVLTP